jgi:hypothetical protein
LEARREILERLARELLEYESLDGGHVYEMIREMTGEDVQPRVGTADDRGHMTVAPPGPTVDEVGSPPEREPAPAGLRLTDPLGSAD